jgi:hypothetical protein
MGQPVRHEMESPFFQAMLVQPPIILNRQLHHFSAFHALLLCQFDNPFLVRNLNKEVTNKDLILLLWVCGTRFQDWQKDYNLDEMIEAAWAWGKEIGEFDTEEVASELEVYLENYIVFPKIWRKTKSKRKASGIPWPFKIAAAVLSHYPSFSEAQVWNMPICRLACYRAEIAEQGGMEVQSMEERKILDRIEAAGLKWVPPEKRQKDDK